MKFYTKIVILFFSGLLISEAHQFLKAGEPHYVNWFIVQPEYPPTIRWYLHDMGLLVRNLFWVTGSYMMATRISRRLKWLMITFLVYCCGDIILYVYCFQLYGYALLYFITGIMALIALNKR